MTQMVLLEAQITQLLAKAEEADRTPLEDGLTVPAEVARRQDRLEKLRAATAQIEARAKERHAEEMATFAEKQQRREAQRAAGKKPRGKEPQPPSEGPRAQDQYNFTDPESRIMKTGSGFAQSDNAQACSPISRPPLVPCAAASAVEVESRLLVSQTVSAAPNDRGGGGD